MDTNLLIQKAQEGDSLAENRLMRLIQQEHMPKRVRSYVGRNVLVKEDEIESEFLLHAWQAAMDAKLDVGNPLLYALWKGEKGVQTLFRRRISKGVQLWCFDCWEIHPASTKRKHTVCPKCESRNVETRMIATSENDMMPDEAWDWGEVATLRSPEEENDLAFEVATFGVHLEEMRSFLANWSEDSAGGRVLELFDILVIEEINRDSSRNYIAEIAERWGVTRTCVSLYLRKLRDRVLQFIEG